MLETTTLKWRPSDNEGAAGIFSLLSADRALGQNLVQLAGDALRLDTAAFKRLVAESAGFHTLMHRYLYRGLRYSTVPDVPRTGDLVQLRLCAPHLGESRATVDYRHQLYLGSG